MLEEMMEALMKMIKCSVIDAACFFACDYVAKNIMKEARSEAFVQLVWLYEVLALSAMSIGLLYYHHTPCILIGITTIMFVSTQILGRLTLAEWIENFKIWWEEHRQMQANMYRTMGASSYPPVKPAVLTDELHTTRNIYPNMYQTVGMFVNNTAANSYIASNINANSQYNVPIYSDMLGNVQSNANNHGAYKANTNKPIDKATDSNLAVNTKKQRLNQSSAVRHNERVCHNSRITHTLFPQGSKSGSTIQSIKDKLTDMGFGHFAITGNSKVPIGLRNDGQNLCFINSVIQCLSKTPGFAAKLELEFGHETHCSVAESNLLVTLVEVFNMCLNGSTGRQASIDSKEFRLAASAINGCPIVSAGHMQTQQDAVEFLMWLLMVLQQLLNKTTKDKSDHSRTSGPAYMSDRIAYFESIYGELTSERVEQLIGACRRDINSRNHDACDEGIARLAELEWFAYKSNNQTVIDEVFSGQVIEAYHCLTDNHITVTTQPFTVLSVPIARRNEISNCEVVRLQDCIEKYCTVESLIGDSGFRCSICNNYQHAPFYSKGPVANKPSRTSLLDSTMNLSNYGHMSPIVSETTSSGSGYYDNRFRTSTPINDVTKRSPTRMRVRTHDAERRCIIWRTPEILIIQLCRFRIHGNQIRKNHTPIKIPLKDFSLNNKSNLFSDQHVVQYDLYGLCLHLGAEAMDTGHYLSYCQDPTTGTWYRFDDNIVTSVNINYELTTKEVRENAYILFYKRN